MIRLLIFFHFFIFSLGSVFAKDKEPVPLDPLAYSDTLRNKNLQGWFSGSFGIGMSFLPASFASTASFEYFPLNLLSTGIGFTLGVSDEKLLNTSELFAKYHLRLPTAPEIADRLIPFVRLGSGMAIIKKDLDTTGKRWRYGILLSPGIGTDYFINDYFAVTLDLRVNAFSKTHDERVYLQATCGGTVVF